MKETKSERLDLRVTPSLKSRIAKEAKKQQRSIVEIVLLALEKYLK